MRALVRFKCLLCNRDVEVDSSLVLRTVSGIEATTCPKCGRTTAAGLAARSGRTLGAQRPGCAPARQSASTKPTCLTEEIEQRRLFERIYRNEHEYPALATIFHVPNGANMGKAQRGVFKALGRRAGVSDIFCPIPMDGYSGLWIELKRLFGGGTSSEQDEWLDYMRHLGHRAEMVRGCDAACIIIVAYLHLPEGLLFQRK